LFTLHSHVFRNYTTFIRQPLHYRGIFSVLRPHRVDAAAAAQLPEEGESVKFFRHPAATADAKINKKRRRGGGFWPHLTYCLGLFALVIFVTCTRRDFLLFPLSAPLSPPIRIQCGAQLTTNLEQTKAARIFMLQLLAPLFLFFLLSRAHTKRFELW
jgi:hypothetical protein